MKYIQIIITLIFVSLGLFSCDKNENFEILPKEEVFEIITPSSGSVIVLNDDNLSNEALLLSWNDPSFTTDTTYNIEVAETGTDFANPIVLGTAQTTNFSMTVDEINTFLLDSMGLNPDEAVSLDIKVSANDSESQIISVIFTPYQVEFTEFFVVGSFTDWDPTQALQMTNVDFNIFELVIDLPVEAEFKFLPTNIDWEGDWGEDPDHPGSLIVEGEQNISGYPEGKYSIMVDMNLFTFTITEIIAPENLYLVGSINGWDPATAIPFNKPHENVFTLVFDLPAGAEFKFLPTNTGWEGDWGEDPNNLGSIIQDGEQNVSGYDAGKYLITVDFNELTYTLTLVENLYVVGSINGWDPASAFPMTEASLGVFSIVIDLPAGAEFKFLPTNTGWEGDWGDDPNSTGMIVQEGEQNVSGYDEGTYVVAVNFNTLTYSVSSVSGIPSTLYLVGSFNGWSNDASNPQFTEISSGVFQIVQTLTASDEFKFVPVAGSWDNDWGQNPDNMGVLEQNSEQNIPSPGDSAYLITVDFNSATIVIQ